MKGFKLIRTLIIVGVLVLNIGCDQVSKMIVRDRIGLEEQISVIQNRVTLMHVENEGAFLSLGSALPELVRLILLAYLPVLAVTIALFHIFYQHSLSKPTLIGYCCIIGGGIGNLYDRLIYGSVTDFMHLDFGVFETGIFNMADVSIMTGIAVLVLQAFREKGVVEDDLHP
jgi:signal peptidase II